MNIYAQSPFFQKRSKRKNFFVQDGLFEVSSFCSKNKPFLEHGKENSVIGNGEDGVTESRPERHWVVQVKSDSRHKSWKLDIPNVVMHCAHDCIRTHQNQRHLL